MKVVAEEPRDWFLLEDEGMLYLDVLVEHGAISFSVTAELSHELAHAFRRDGRAALGQVVGKMRHKALMREWRAPPMPSSWSARSIAAIQEWQKQRST